MLVILIQLAIVFGLSFFTNKYLNYYYFLEYFLLFATVLFINAQPTRISFKLSWIVFIALFTPEGLILYTAYFLFLRINVFSKRHFKIQDETAFLEVQNQDILDNVTDLDVKQQIDLIYRQSRYPVSNNTEFKYLPLGEDYQRELLVELKKAKKYIFMQYFIITGGQMLDEIMEILIEKANKGVEVYFSYDVGGSITTRPSNFDDNCKANNINILPFNKNIASIYQFVSFRDHRKISVIDGTVAFTGGINIGDEYINKNVRFGHWKDMGVKLQGDGAKNLAMIFMKGWNFSSPNTFKYENYVTNLVHEVVSDDVVAAYDDGPFSDDDVAEKTYIRMISSAKKYCYITTPYLIPSFEILSALKMAAYSGVDVRIMTPGIPDKKMIFECSRSYYNDLIKSGVKIFEYSPGFVHGKTCVVDDKVAFVGSVNFDFRSLVWNYECGAWIYSKDFAISVKDDTLKSIEKSNEVTLQELKKAPFYIKIFRSAINLLGPLL